MQELKVSGREAGQRFDKFLKKYLSEAPGSFIYKMLRKKNITLNGKKADGSEKIAEGDLVKLFLSDETIANFRKNALSSKASLKLDAVSEGNLPELQIIYEDEDLIFVNKPSGLLSQGDSRGEVSLAELINAREDRDGSRMSDSGSFKVSPANRLDRNTSGLVLCGKTIRGMQFLSEMIRNRDVKKEYLVLCSGEFSYRGVKKVWYKKDEEKNLVKLYGSEQEGCGFMLTGFAPVKANDEFSLLRIDLLTGRPHQIRAHLAFLGHSVLGDPKYGNKEVNREVKKKFGITHQMLHAARIRFPDSINDDRFSYLAGKVFEAPLPEDFAAAAALMHLL